MRITAHDHLKKLANRRRLIVISNTHLIEDDCTENLLVYGSIKKIEFTSDHRAAFVIFDCEHTPLLITRCFEYYQTNKKVPMPKGVTKMLPGCSHENFLYLKNVPRLLSSKVLRRHYSKFFNCRDVIVHRLGTEEDPSTRVVIELKENPSASRHQDRVFQCIINHRATEYSFYAVSQLTQLIDTKRIFETDGCDDCNVVDLRPSMDVEEKKRKEAKMDRTDLQLPLNDDNEGSSNVRVSPPRLPSPTVCQEPSEVNSSNNDFVDELSPTLSENIPEKKESCSSSILSSTLDAPQQEIVQRKVGGSDLKKHPFSGITFVRPPARRVSQPPTETREVDETEETNEGRLTPTLSQLINQREWEFDIASSIFSDRESEFDPEYLLTDNEDQWKDYMRELNATRRREAGRSKREEERGPCFTPSLDVQNALMDGQTVPGSDEIDQESDISSFVGSEYGYDERDSDDLISGEEDQWISVGHRPPSGLSSVGIVESVSETLEKEEKENNFASGDAPLLMMEMEEESKDVVRNLVERMVEIVSDSVPSPTAVQEHEDAVYTREEGTDNETIDYDTSSDGNSVTNDRSEVIVEEGGDEECVRDPDEWNDDDLIEYEFKRLSTIEEESQEEDAVSSICSSRNVFTSDEEDEESIDGGYDGDEEEEEKEEDKVMKDKKKRSIDRDEVEEVKKEDEEEDISHNGEQRDTVCCSAPGLCPWSRRSDKDEEEDEKRDYEEEVTILNEENMEEKERSMQFYRMIAFEESHRSI